MLIIIEGSDGVGKSTLARELATFIKLLYPDHTVDVFHAGPPQHHPLDEYERPLFTYRPNRGHHIICDRWHVGEWIYPGIFARKTHANVASWRHIDMFIASRGGVIVHVDAPDIVIKKRLRERGDDMVTADQAIYAAGFYRQLLGERSITHMPIIRTTSVDTHGIIDKIVQQAWSCDNEARALHQFTTYIGPTKPKYLILGDVRGHLKHILGTDEANLDLQPAFMPYPGTSGQFLLTHLLSSVVTTCGLANSCDVDDLASLISVLNCPKTIALGKNARDMLRSVGGYHLAPSLPHPQYIRRFHAKHGAQYGSAIATALNDEDPHNVHYWTSWRPRSA